MWPLTWADDDALYAGAGDNMGSPMILWKISGNPAEYHSWSVSAELLHPRPISPERHRDFPGADDENGVKPAGMLHCDGILYMAVELMNHGEDPTFNRQL